MSKLLKTQDNFFAILLLFGLFTIYFALLVLQIIMLYINYVCVLKACFKRINDNLLHMQKFIINDMKPGASNVIQHTQRNQFLLIELRVLKKQHLMISDAVQMLNMIFNLQLLAIVIYFLTLTFDLYFFAFGWQNLLDLICTFLMYF